MLKPALVVIVFGAMVGFMWPSGPASRKVDAKAAAAQRQAAVARASDPALDTVLDRKSDGHFYIDAADLLLGIGDLGQPDWHISDTTKALQKLP